LRKELEELKKQNHEMKTRIEMILEKLKQTEK
jgi:hypothetical protein